MSHLDTLHSCHISTPICRASKRASERGRKDNEKGPGRRNPGPSLFLIRWGLQPIQEPISESHEAKAQGEARCEDDGAPPAHHAHRVAGDNEERCNECRSAEDEESGEDGGDGSNDVHDVAPFVAGPSGYTHQYIDGAEDVKAFFFELDYALKRQLFSYPT